MASEVWQTSERLKACKESAQSCESYRHITADGRVCWSNPDAEKEWIAMNAKIKQLTRELARL